MRLCRLIVDEPGEGAWNMAVDDVLLTRAAERGEAALRFYGWAKPTLSLGYFQAYQSRDEHAPSRDCPVVRRASGGGAILHDLELTYALALPAEFWPERGRLRLYSVVHQSLCESFAALGVEGARMFGEDHESAFGGESNDIEPPFLCFDRRSEFDLVLPRSVGSSRSIKVAGSAQRGQYRAVLQHGSVLLARSVCAPTLAGLLEASGAEISSGQLVDAWCPSLAEALGVRLLAGSHSAETLAEADRLRHDKFAADAWLRRR